MKTKVYLLLFSVLLTSIVFAQQPNIKIQTIAPGVIKLSMGNPDKFSPYTFCTEKPKVKEMKLLSNTPLPFDLKEVIVVKNSRGVQIRIPLNNDEQLYGFGMQIGTFEQRGLRKRPVVNDNPSNVGFTHAPQPFYVSTAGYGVLVNSSRYITFLCGTNQEHFQQTPVIKEQEKLKFSTQELYANQAQSKMSMWIDVPSAEGVEIFFFQGETLKESVQRYNQG